MPIVCDMSSDMFSRPFDVEQFGLIYAGAQKHRPGGRHGGHCSQRPNRPLGTQIAQHAGLQAHMDNGSMYNTPPVFPLYVTMLTLRWLKADGGLAIQQKNEAKAAILYDEIDANPLFKGTVAKEDRSLMNVCFLPTDTAHEAPFMEAAKAAGIDGIKGHRSVGGFRASIYNAMPQESVQVLVDVMREFAKQNG